MRHRLSCPRISVCVRMAENIDIEINSGIFFSAIGDIFTSKMMQSPEQKPAWNLRMGNNARSFRWCTNARQTAASGLRDERSVPNEGDFHTKMIFHKQGISLSLELLLHSAGRSTQQGLRIFYGVEYRYPLTPNVLTNRTLPHLPGEHAKFA